MIRFGRPLLAGVTLFVSLSALIHGQDSSTARPGTPSTSGQNHFRPVGEIQNAAIPISPQRYPPARGTPLSAQIVPAAGLIFAGHVTSVWRASSPAGSTSAPTEITFQVDEGIRGTSTGQQLTIREWAGLWDRGERYRIGESVFLFLYPPSRLGLTSPVYGGSGRFAIDAQRRIVINAHALAIAADPAVGGTALVPYVDFERTVLRSVVEK
jgi:hypothetical protein